MRQLFILLFMLITCQSSAQIQTFTLQNGLKVLVKEDHRAPVAVSMLWYNVGSADEPGGLSGVSHALEHLMFKGTPNHALGTFSKIIASLGGEDNAFTNYDYTAYFEEIAASKLATCFELEADRMQHLLLDKTEFAKELKVIREERRLRTDNNPQALALERYLATAHLSPPYQHPVIGWMSDLYKLTVDDAKQWYQQFYAPNNATLVVVGDVHAAEVQQLAMRYFGPISKHSNYQRKAQREPPSFGSKLLNVHVPAKIPMLIFGYTVPSVKTAEHLWEPYALDIIRSILTTSDSSRFARNLLRGSQLASGIDIDYNLYSRYQSQFMFFGLPAKTHTVEELKQGILKEIKRLQETLVDTNELNRVKTQIIAQKTFEKDSIFGQAMELGLLETIGLGWQTANSYTERINHIDAKQIQAVAQKYFREINLTEARLIPSLFLG